MSPPLCGSNLQRNCSPQTHSGESRGESYSQSYSGESRGESYSHSGESYSQTHSGESRGESYSQSYSQSHSGESRGESYSHSGESYSQTHSGESYSYSEESYSQSGESRGDSYSHTHSQESRGESYSQTHSGESRGESYSHSGENRGESYSQSGESRGESRGESYSQSGESRGESYSQDRSLCRLLPSDPARQARRLPLKVLRMLTAHTAHLLHPEYLQPIPATPSLSAIELDAKKSPLALLAQTCSQIGKSDSPSSSKMNAVTSAGLTDKDPGRSASLKCGDSPSDDKSSFKPYSKAGEGRKETVAQDKVSFRLPSAACQPFPARACSPPAAPRPGSSSPARGDGKGCEAQDKKEPDPGKPCPPSPPPPPPPPLPPHTATHGRLGASESGRERDTAAGGKGEAAGLGAGHVAPVSPYKSGHSVFPLPPSTMGYHGSIVGAYAGYPSQFVTGIDPGKAGLAGGQLPAGLGCGLTGKPVNTSPLSGTSPPTFLQGLCRDPYCLTYHSGPHLGGNPCSSCLHDPPGLKSAYPLVYPSHPFHSVHSSALAANAHPLYAYGFMVPNDPIPHMCNWVSAAGPCDKRFASSEELLNHLRTHTALPGVDKLLAGYPASGLAGSANCHLHLPQGSPGSLSLRNPHTLGLNRYQPYSKNHLPVPSGPPGLSGLSLPTTGPYYSPYTLYGQRLTSASALGYQ